MNSGLYVGTSNGEPVLVNMLQAWPENKPPVGVILGGLGQGKSYAANFYTFLHVKNGGRAIVIDPKGERRHWSLIPHIGKDVNVVDISGDAKNKGLLDPFAMFDDRLDYAADLAFLSIVDLLEIESNTNSYIILRECVKKVTDGERPNMQKIVQALGEVGETDEFYREASMLHKNLSWEMDKGLSQLIFGNGTEQTINLDSRITVISFKDLNIPRDEKSKENFNYGENMAGVLMCLACSFIEQFAWKYPNEPKLAVIDEVGMLLSSKGGGGVIKRLIWMGKILLATLLIGQFVQDVSCDDIKYHSTYKVVFNPQNIDEACRALDYLNLDNVSPDMLMSLQNGQCLFKNKVGNADKLSIDAAPKDLADFL